jgi:hypothetical protein
MVHLLPDSVVLTPGAVRQLNLNTVVPWVVSLETTVVVPFQVCH